MFRWGQGSHRDNFPYLDTCVDVLVRSVPCIFPSHLLLDGLAPSGDAVVCGMGHLRQRGKLGRKHEQDEAQEEDRAGWTHTGEPGRSLLLHSDQLRSEKTFERDIIAKTQPNSSQRCTINGQEPVGTSCSKENFWLYIYIKKLM